MFETNLHAGRVQRSLHVIVARGLSTAYTLLIWDDWHRLQT